MSTDATTPDTPAKAELDGLDGVDELDGLVEEDLLVEDISIDGMCGVY
ncbi:mycofactocin precursor MftA [Streptomyces sp. NBC_00564]|nr:mycofactocin precursor MftA [Streptomyces sp. NBC_00564]WUC47067.1 mycofactocin precursor MftA [Streptomyces sp. NBC_00554]